MSPSDPREFRLQILSPTPLPVGFKRENPKALRYRPYSNKARRFLDIYTPLAFDLWLLLEWQINVVSINERVCDVLLPGGNNDILKIKPEFVTVAGADNHLIIHSIVGADEIDDASLELFALFEQYLRQFDVGFKTWKPSEIRENTVLLTNIEQLLCPMTESSQLVDSGLRESLVTAIRNHRKTTVNVVLESLQQYDETEVLIALSDLLQRGHLFSDIDSYPYGYTTQLSAYHEFSDT
ncbi:MAG: hypothetical protein WCA83_11790 [Azonexus sp.]